MIRTSLKLNTRLGSKDIALVGMMVATIEAGKLAMSFLPNIEPVTLFIILYTLKFGPKVLYAIFIFIILEGFLYGFGIWWFVYLYIWPLLSILTMIFRKYTSLWFWMFFSTLFGLSFGLLSSLTTLVLSGPQAAFSYFIAGIPFDLLHGVGNFAITGALFLPLRKILTKVRIWYLQ